MSLRVAASKRIAILLVEMSKLGDLDLLVIIHQCKSLTFLSNPSHRTFIDY